MLTTFVIHSLRYKCSRLTSVARVLTGRTCFTHWDQTYIPECTSRSFLTDFSAKEIAKRHCLAFFPWAKHVTLLWRKLLGWVSLQKKLLIFRVMFKQIQPMSISTSGHQEGSSHNSQTSAVWRAMSWCSSCPSDGTTSLKCQKRISVPEVRGRKAASWVRTTTRWSRRRRRSWRPRPGVQSTSAPCAS